MSLRARIADLGNSLKGKVDAALGGSQELADSDHVVDDTPRAPPMDEPRARAVLGLGPDATLDVVRAAAAARAKVTLARAVAGDADALAALDDTATAAELLEERLLPLAAPSSSPSTSSPSSTGGSGAPHRGSRQRATERR